MNFDFTPEEEAFRSKIHSWLEKTSGEVFGRGKDGAIGTSTTRKLWRFSRTSMSFSKKKPGWRRASGTTRSAEARTAVYPFCGSKTFQ